MKEQILYIHTGDEFLPINSKISKNELQKILSDTFVPYIECFNKCGKAEICRLTDNLRYRNRDQECGVRQTNRVKHRYDLHSCFPEKDSPCEGWTTSVVPC